MKTATVGEIQKNFAGVLREIKAGEEIIVTSRGEPVARITAVGPKKDIDWPDAFARSLDLSRTHTECKGSRSLEHLSRGVGPFYRNPAVSHF